MNRANGGAMAPTTFESVKQTLQRQFAHLSNDQRQQLVVELMQSCASEATPRSLTNRSVSMSNASSSTAPMDRIAASSAPAAAVPMMRRHSTKTGARRLSSQCPPPTTQLDGLQSNLDEPFSYYRLEGADSTRMPQVITGPLPPVDEVYDPADWLALRNEPEPSNMLLPTYTIPPSVNNFAPTRPRTTSVRHDPTRLSVSTPANSYAFGSQSSLSMSPKSPISEALFTPSDDMSRSSSNYFSVSDGDNAMSRMLSSSSQFSFDGIPSFSNPPVRHSLTGSSLFVNDHVGGVLNTTDSFSLPMSLATNAAEESYLSSQEGGIGRNMNRSESMQSNSSQSSTQSQSPSHSQQRSQRRRSELLQQQTKMLVPKPSPVSPTTTTASHQRQSSTSSLRQGSTSGRPKSQAISRNPYIRPRNPKLTCPHCDEHPTGFRGEHELRRHIDRAHSEPGAMRKVYMCVDTTTPDCGPIPPVKLHECKQCSKNKKYNAYYNAAAHLRRTHFFPRARGRRSKGEEKRGGKGGGEHPPMEYLRTYWIKEIMVPVGQDDEFDAKCEEEIDNEDDDLSAGAPETDSFSLVSGGISPASAATMMLTNPATTTDFCDLGEMADVGRTSATTAADFVMLDSSFNYSHADFAPLQMDAAVDSAALFSFDDAVFAAAAAGHHHHQQHQNMHLHAQMQQMQAPQYPQHLSLHDSGFDTDMI